MQYRYFIMLWGLLLMASCEPEIAVPDFQITTESNTYQVGEEILFQVQGNADMIAFYSGEPTNDYRFKDGRVIDVADQGVTMEFSSGVTLGEQEEQLRILASTDFDGNYDNLSSVQNANWVDITDRFVLGTSATFVPSTVQDISDLVVPESPIFIAFKYETRPQAIHGIARNWMIQTFALKSAETLDEVPVVITDQASAGFRIVDQEPENAPSMSTVTTTRVSLLGNVYKDPNDPIYDPENPIFDPENPIYDPESDLYEPGEVRPEFVPYDPSSPYNDPHTENWAISKPLMIDQVDLGPDRSAAIKGIANSKLEEFSYTYSKPGTYRAYFVAINATIDGRKETVREFEFVIVP